MQASNLTTPKISMDQDDFNTFLTEAVTDMNPLKTVVSNNSANFTPRGVPTKLGLVGEVDVVDGILDKVKAKTRRINVDSPRTKQALTTLGIQKEECIIKKFENFSCNVKNEKMQKLLYAYYVGHVNDIIAQVLDQREKLKQVRKGRTLSLEQPTVPTFGDRFPTTFKNTMSPPATAKGLRGNFVTMDYGDKVEKINERNVHKVQIIERQAMLFLESERAYLKKLEKIKTKHEKIEVNRKTLEDKRLEEVKQKRERYNLSVEKAKKLGHPVEEDDEDNYDEPKKSVRLMTAKDFKDMHIQSFAKVQEHKLRESKFVEEQKVVDARIEKRNIDSDLKSNLAMIEFEQKQTKFRDALGKVVERRKTSIGNWIQKFSKTKEFVINTDADESAELYTKYAEKIKRYEVQTAKNETQRAKYFEDRKKQREERLKEVEEKLINKEIEHEQREAEIKERLTNQTERVTHFQHTKASQHVQKTDLNKYRLQRSYIHFGRVLAEDTHKANVIMNKNKTWKEAFDKKQTEKELVRNASMQNQFKIQAEKQSLTHYLDQVSKLQQSKEIIAGKLKKTQTGFNVQPMAEYINENFVKKPQKQNTNKDYDSLI